MSNKDVIIKSVGPYECRGILGRGSHAIIYRARLPGQSEEVALKALKINMSDEVKELFRKEIISLSALSHKNIISILDYDLDAAEVYYTMNIVEGETLHQHLVRNKKISPKDWYALLLPLASAIDYAHRLGVIHCDLKPGNIMLDMQRNPVILDFGLSRVLNEFQGKEKKSEFVYITPAYAAPEYLEREEVAPAVDIYSLGVITYECLTGGRPFKALNYKRLVEKIMYETMPPVSLKAPELAPYDYVLSRALNKLPGSRYSTAEDFVIEYREKGGFPILHDAHTNKISLQNSLPRMLFIGSALVFIAICSVLFTLPVFKQKQIAQIKEVEVKRSPLQLYDNYADSELIALFSGSPTVRDVQELIKEASKRRLFHLHELGPTLLFHDSYLVRKLFVEHIAFLPVKHKMAFYVEALHDTEPRVRIAALKQLQHEVITSHENFLRNMYRVEKDESVRAAFRKLFLKQGMTIGE